MPYKFTAQCIKTKMRNCCTLLLEWSFALSKKRVPPRRHAKRWEKRISAEKKMVKKEKKHPYITIRLN